MGLDLSIVLGEARLLIVLLFSYSLILDLGLSAILVINAWLVDIFKLLTFVKVLYSSTFDMSTIESELLSLFQVFDVQELISFENDWDLWLDISCSIEIACLIVSVKVSHDPKWDFNPTVKYLMSIVSTILLNYLIFIALCELNPHLGYAYPWPK